MEADLSCELTQRICPQRTPRLERNVPRGVASKQRQQQATYGKALRQKVGTGSYAVIRGEESSNRSCRRYPEVARGFVQADRKPPPAGSDAVDLHVYSDRPGEALISTEQRDRKH